MKLPVLYVFSSSKGITLFEVIITIAIFALLIGFSSPFTVNLYQEREFDVHLKSIVQSLRRAQLRAMTGEGESSFGIYFGPHQYVLFKGDSYAGRDAAFDELFELPDDFSISGISELVFGRIKGIPSDRGDITLISGDKLGTINVNEVGMINY